MLSVRARVTRVELVSSFRYECTECQCDSDVQFWFCPYVRWPMLLTDGDCVVYCIQNTDQTSSINWFHGSRSTPDGELARHTNWAFFGCGWKGVNLHLAWFLDFSNTIYSVQWLPKLLWQAMLADLCVLEPELWEERPELLFSKTTGFVGQIHLCCVAAQKGQGSE